MRGRWAIALVGLLLVPSGWGQMRGGARAGAPMAHPGFAAHAPVSHGAVVIGSFNSGVRFRTGFGGPFFVNRGFRHRRVFLGGYPWGYYYNYYPGYDYSDYSYTPSSYPAYDSSYYQPNSEMALEMERLSDEVAGLRAEQEARYAAPRPEPAAKPEIHEPTLLIFRDKHTQETENYAIVGQTLWIFSEQRATKVPLSSLDIDATTKVNDERGVGFRLPK